MFLLFFASVPLALAGPEASGEKPVIVGRISHVEGQLLRYVPEEKDWVATVKDAPFGFDDALYADEDVKAEVIMPNNSWVRVGGNTQAQLITLEKDVTEVDVASGIARFFNKSRNVVIKATTPFGYVVGPVGSVFDLYVGDESVEVIALKGSVEFVHDGDETRYEVNEGAGTIVADSRDVTTGEGSVDAYWDDWNAERDEIWSKRLEVKGDSVRYLPAQLHDESYVLEEHGRWERVRYEGGYRNFWRPVRVSAGWAPFTVGRWTEWNGDNTWVPDEPFGYVTHHYGNWVFVNNYWYWYPPVVSVGVHVRPAVGIGFGWCPGRVAWIHTGVEIGWVPLAPAEPYYAYHYWGPGAVVVGAVGLAAININIGGFAYLNHAVVVNQNNFYNVNNYNSVRITNINRTTIINNYRAAPVVNNTVINNYNKINQRYNFRNVQVTNKPHQTVLSRIERNEKIAGQERNVNAKLINQGVSQARPGRPGKEGSVQAPKVTRKIVPSNEVNKPKSEVQFHQKSLKEKTRPVQGPKEGRRGSGPEGRRGSPAIKPHEGALPPGERGSRVKPSGQERGAGSVERGQPRSSGEVGRSRHPARQQPIQREGRQLKGRRTPTELGQPRHPAQRMPQQKRGKIGRERREPAVMGQPRHRAQPAQRSPRHQFQQERRGGQPRLQQTPKAQRPQGGQKPRGHQGEGGKQKHRRGD